MNDYYKYMREFEKSVAGLSNAMDGMHQQHMMLKKQFRRYVTDHETFTQNVRSYLDEMEHGDAEQQDPVATTSTKGQNDNERNEQRVPTRAGE